MHSTMLSAAAALLLFTASIQGTVTKRAPANCTATKDYPGFAKIKYLFSFGDSYTQTGFNENDKQPSAENPIGNPPFPGYTSSNNAPNWIGYLTATKNASQLLTYNVASGGAMIDCTLVEPYAPTVICVNDQVSKVWSKTYSSKPASAPWKSEDSVFLFWDGVNDVGNTWYMPEQERAALWTKIFAVWRKQLDTLYEAGARNFAFLTTPPVDRSPLALTNSPEQQKTEKDAVAVWNGNLTELVKGFKKEKADTNVFTVDTSEIFNKAMDTPTAFKETAGLKNTTGFCADYANGTPKQDTLIPACGVAVNQYFWLNNLHPTSAVHEVVAISVAKALTDGPNIC
ncbi:hypothetical protein HYALB_00010643 [Hymenoscyphus albidus]|uniref:Carbohydrate esterase family 16 protein n=1 Tax=Hymenoscyphus albidus TaxID=595503 RepID=A0A9N9LKV9_9HELO|nr:hypothetical protein HYALB_00010643 [Hymenoscyphus albidus]